MIMMHRIQRCCRQEFVQNLTLSFLVFWITFLTSTYLLTPRQDIERWLGIEDIDEQNASVSLAVIYLNETAKAIKPTGINLNKGAFPHEISRSYTNENDLPLKPSREHPIENNNPLKFIQGKMRENDIQTTPIEGLLRKSDNQLKNRKANNKQIDDQATERLARKEKMLGMTFDHGDGGNCTKVLPQALIIGVMECGTEPLTTFLAIHPDIAMQLKLETVQFFNNNYGKGYDWYRSQMACSSETQITIEKSPQYFTSPYVPKRVQKMNKNIKLIVLVRDPIKRAISHYDHVVSVTPDKLPDSFEKAIISPLGHIDGGHETLQRSVYSIQLKRWLNYFNMDQIHIVDGENFIKQPAEELNKIETFLGIRQYFTKMFFTYNRDNGFFCLNVLGGPKGCMIANQGRKHQEISPDVMDKLKQFYKHYNEEFVEITGQNFDWGY